MLFPVEVPAPLGGRAILWPAEALSDRLCAQDGSCSALGSCPFAQFTPQISLGCRTSVGQVRSDPLVRSSSGCRLWTNVPMRPPAGAATTLAVNKERPPLRVSHH